MLAELLNHYTGHIIVSLCCFVGYFCLCCVLLRFRIFLFAGVSLSSNAFDLPGLLYNTLMFPSILQTLHKILVLFFDMKVTQIRRADSIWYLIHHQLKKKLPVWISWRKWPLIIQRSAEYVWKWWDVQIKDTKWRVDTWGLGYRAIYQFV